MKDPVVSVVIPHYNRTRLLAETVDSVKKQSLKEWEIIVVDDGSEEAEWDNLQRFREEKVRIFQRGSRPKGPSACRNIGIREASGEYVIFLDSDDLLAPWCLESRIKDFRENPSFDFLVYPSLLFEHKPGDSNRLWNKLDDASDHLERFLYSDPPWCVTGPIWKIESLVKLGGFNEAVFYGDDAELHIRSILDNLGYCVSQQKPPDNFVRRSTELRITSGLSSEIVISRLVFLEVVMQLLIKFKTKAWYKQVWEGEYFTEMEFLLFKREPEKHLNNIYKSYVINLKPNILKRSIVKLYITLGYYFIRRSYFTFKTIRRVFFIFLPKTYSVRPKNFDKAFLADSC